ncbi:ParA family protein [Vibrio sp. S11_S32]|uniref:ParA family protein n=1 Tax=Vibrio sp. S11_S32 TaxID=2720225 RepID=UPI001681445C|nr:ParA family protein [Vibrio sp. S11_S32]MBD1577085.1 ParA family protein [Vibrio sp. S11_S32]
MSEKVHEAAKKTLKLITALANEFDKVSQITTDSALRVNDLTESDKSNIAPNGKLYRTYNKSELYTDLNITTGSSRLERLTKSLDIPTQYNNLWRVNLLDRNKIKREIGRFPLFKRSASQELAIFVVSNLKGGSGKTTLSSLLSTGLAVESERELRIGVIDLDPQGTLTRIMQPRLKVASRTDNYTSVGDLMISERMNFQNEDEFIATAKNAFLPTNYPNLKILPANQSDTDFELSSRMKALESSESGYSSYLPLQRLICAIEEDFDVLIIDTPPALNEVSIAAHYVATHMLIPLKASENDRDSTGKYLFQLASLYRYLAALGHKGYSSIKFVPSAIDSRSPVEKRIATWYETICGSLITKYIPLSEAIRSTGEDLNTLYDVSPSSYAGKRNTCVTAQESMSLFIGQIDALLSSHWNERNWEEN